MHYSEFQIAKLRKLLSYLKDTKSFFAPNLPQREKIEFDPVAVYSQLPVIRKQDILRHLDSYVSSSFFKGFASRIEITRALLDVKNLTPNNDMVLTDLQGNHWCIETTSTTTKVNMIVTCI